MTDSEPQAERTIEERLDELEWLMSRINTKLDNLGQLRHLYKMQRRMNELSNSLSDIALYYRAKGKKELGMVFPERLVGRDNNE